MNTTDKYRKLRREHPLIAASHLWRWAKHTTDHSDWEARSHSEGYTKEIDNFTVTLTTEDESQYPQEGDMGHYVEIVRGEDYEWNGNYPRPTEEFPLNLPYTSFAAAAYTQSYGRDFYYWVPDGVDEQYEYFRRCGQSKSVSWDMTKQWVEDTISSFFGDPLVYTYVKATVIYEGANGNTIELASDGLGTSYLGYDDDYIFEAANDSGLVETALEEAHKALDELRNVG